MNKFLKKVKYALYYAGLKEDEYDDILDIYLSPNRAILMVFSALVAFVTMGFLGFTFLTGTLIESRIGYLMAFMVSVGILILDIFLAKDSPKLLDFITQLFVISIYLMGIFNGTKGDPDNTALTFIVLIMVLPILFNGRPIVMIAQMEIAVVFFIICVLAFKEPKVWMVDIANAFAFSLMSVIMVLFLSRIRAQGCIAQYRNRESRAELEEALRVQKSQYDIMSALSRNYLNIYLWNLAEDTAVSVKLDGFTTKGMVKGMSFAYAPMCERYVESRVAMSDQVEMLQNMKRENVLEQLKDKQEYQGIYRVYEDGGIHHFQFVYTKTENPNFVLVAFQNVDATIGEQLSQKNALREALDEAQAASAAKTSFLFNMSHDIRTPMNAIMGFTELAEKYKNDPKRQSDYLAKIKSSGEILLLILNNVLEMARIEKGTVTVDEQPANMVRGIKSIFVLFDEQLKKKNITFTSSINVTHQYIYYDETKTREIFMNIISNAIKYTEDGGSISASFEELPADRDGYITIKSTISDTGIGMSEEFLSKIFDEFAREKNSERNVIEGTGLGMAITKRFVDILGGTITVDSKQGEGSTFTVMLTHRVADEADVEVSKRSLAKLSDFFDKHILLAEDNDLNAEIAVEMLKSFGFKVERAKDGKECVDIITEMPADTFDAILMDIQMPVLNGYEATQIIRNMPDAEKRDIPIVALTANAFEEDRRNAFEAGMNAHLAKPIVVDDVINTMSNVLGN